MRERQEKEEASTKAGSRERDRGRERRHGFLFALILFNYKQNTSRLNEVVPSGIAREIFNLREMGTYS